MHTCRTNIIYKYLYNITSLINTGSINFIHYILPLPLHYIHCIIYYIYLYTFALYSLYITFALVMCLEASSDNCFTFSSAWQTFVCIVSPSASFSCWDTDPPSSWPGYWLAFFVGIPWRSWWLNHLIRYIT